MKLNSIFHLVTKFDGFICAVVRSILKHTLKTNYQKLSSVFIIEVFDSVVAHNIRNCGVLQSAELMMISLTVQAYSPCSELSFQLMHNISPICCQICVRTA